MSDKSSEVFLIMFQFKYFLLHGSLALPSAGSNFFLCHIPKAPTTVHLILYLVLSVSLAMLKSPSKFKEGLSHTYFCISHSTL